MSVIEPIQSEEEYFQVLNQVLEDAMFIESGQYQQLPIEEKQSIMQRYNYQSFRVYKYKGLI
jgi:hypothetical protein